jgi:hypothetical protein
VRQQVAHAGLPEFDLRDGSGQTLSRFIHDPGSPRPRLDRDYVYGAGLIERVVTAQPPTVGVQHPMIAGSSVSLNSSTGSGTYSGDLTTPSGWTTYVSGLTADASGNFLLPEAELRANEVNFLRLRKEGSSETGYSAPIALITDSTVSTGSANQVRALSVHRAGNSVTIRWSLLTTNNKAFRLFFRRADNGATYSLTPQGLPTVTRTLSLDAQALSAPCGSFFLTQIQSNGSDTAESAKADLPSPNSGAAGRTPCGGGSGTGPPPFYSWKNLVHFRDHLFSLRVLTDESGKREQGTDFFPYGLELVPDAKSAGILSRAKYTMHDRDEETGIDDLVMRAKQVRGLEFLGVDFVDTSLQWRPHSLNRYAYARSRPNLTVDPLGLFTREDCEIIGGHVSDDGYCVDGQGRRIFWIDGTPGYTDSVTVCAHPPCVSIDTSLWENFLDWLKENHEYIYDPRGTGPLGGHLGTPSIRIDPKIPIPCRSPSSDPRIRELDARSIDSSRWASALGRAAGIVSATGLVGGIAVGAAAASAPGAAGGAGVGWVLGKGVSTPLSMASTSAAADALSAAKAADDLRPSHNDPAPFNAMV